LEQNPENVKSADAVEIRNCVVIAQVETRNSFGELEIEEEGSELSCPPPPKVEYPRVQESKKEDRRKPRMLRINRKEWRKCGDQECGGCEREEIGEKVEKEICVNEVEPKKEMVEMKMKFQVAGVKKPLLAPPH
jgi:hypothetical protein